MGCNDRDVSTLSRNCTAPTNCNCGTSTLSDTTTNTGTSTTLSKSCRTAARPSPAPSGNPLWGSRALTWTDVMMTVVSLCTDSGVRGGVGRPFAKGGDARRSGPPGNNSVGSVTNHRTDTLPLQTPWLALSFTSQAPHEGWDLTGC